MKIDDAHFRRLIERCLDVLSAYENQPGQNELENAQQRALRDLQLRGRQLLEGKPPIDPDEFQDYAEEVYDLADYLSPARMRLH